jgi:uroporphyrinogen decarboxylase
MLSAKKQRPLSGHESNPMKTSKKRLIRALKGESLERPPFWLMRQAGRYLPEYREVRAQAGSFLDLCYNPDLAAEVTLQPLRRYRPDAAILFADILLVPHGMGQHLEYREGEGPVFDPIRSAGELARLEPARMHDVVAPVYETVSRLRTELPAEVALIGFAGAPWTVACYMVEGQGSRDFASARQWALQDPEGFGQLIAILVTATIEYLERQIEAGAEAVQLFDTWAGILPPAEFTRWCIEPVARIVSALKEKYPDLPVIGFPKGVGIGYAGFAAATGVDGLSIDWTVPPAWARDQLQGECTIQGNLDPQILRAGGAVMERETSRILQTLSNGPFIFNLGHGIDKDTPPDHVARLASLLHEWPTSRDAG